MMQPPQQRLYATLLAAHLADERQMTQCVIDSPFVAADCFRANRPVIVPARTFLSQLL